MRVDHCLPSGQLLRIVYENEVDTQAHWLAEFATRLEERSGSFSEGCHIQIGWSVLTVVRRELGLQLVEPDFAGDPFKDTREDLTVSLRVMAEQTLLLKLLGISRSPVRFDETISVAKGSLAETKLNLQREIGTRGASGWVITAPSCTTDMEAIPTYRLLKCRPICLRVLVLPAGSGVLIDGNSISALSLHGSSGAGAEALVP